MHQAWEEGHVAVWKGGGLGGDDLVQVVLAEDGDRGSWDGIIKTETGAPCLPGTQPCGAHGYFIAQWGEWVAVIRQGSSILC